MHLSKSHKKPMYMVDKANSWSLSSFQKMPSLREVSLMSWMLWQNNAMCSDLGELLERSCMGWEQSSLNSSVDPLPRVWPLNHNQLPIWIMPRLAISQFHSARLRLYSSRNIL
jgi:hypothetical protein